MDYCWCGCGRCGPRIVAAESLEGLGRSWKVLEGLGRFLFTQRAAAFLVLSMSHYPATTEQVAWAFLERCATHKSDLSGQIAGTDSWIQTELPTLTLDLDYEMAWLIVVHDRSTDTWPWFVIAALHGPKVTDGVLEAWTHDAIMLSTDTFDSEEATAEALPLMFGLLDSLRDAAWRNDHITASGQALTH